MKTNCNFKKISSTSSDDHNQTVKKSNNLHEFLLIHLTKSFDDQELRKLYADFKSRGGIASATPSPSSQSTNNNTARRLVLKEESDNTGKDRLNQQQQQQRMKNAQQQFDCLDIYNRQQLAVLFYSQCEMSPVYPNICNKPRIINMKFYGENDMTLGIKLKEKTRKIE